MNQFVLEKQELMLSRWRDLVNTGALKPVGVSTIIVESWEECYNAGLDPYQKISFIKHKKTPQNLSNKVQTYLTLFYPIMKQAMNSIKGAGFQLYLVDQNACVLECIPDSGKIIDNWSEYSLGTNALSIAIIKQQNAQVIGAEHYCYAFHNSVSSAVPIFDAQGYLFGALGLIGSINEDHSHVFSVLSKAADKMMDRMTIKELNNKLSSLSETLNQVTSSVTDGIMILNTEGIIKSVNSTTENITGRESQEIIGFNFRDLCENFPLINQNDDEPLANIDALLKSFNKKYHCKTSIQMIEDKDEDIAGSIVFIRKNDTAVTKSTKCPHSKQYGFNSIMGKSKKLLECIHIAHMAVNNMSNVLLQGESGTGKDIIAQAIHHESPRRNGPFIAVNCGAIPPGLVSSELFGYVDGAFSGAKRGGQPGKFEAAKGGTLFLDEIGDMPLEAQVALLRVLEERKVIRVGSFKEIPVDVRVICATNKNLYAEVYAGRFREDLYFRINVIFIYIPPLRERDQDILLLIKYYLARLGASTEYINKIIKSPLAEELMQYQWPGNVRELQNVIERLMYIGKEPDLIRLKDLHLKINKLDSLSSSCITSTSNYNNEKYKDRKKQLIMLDESNEIKALMKKHNGNVTRVAAEMGFSRVTLYRKLKLYDI